MNNKKGITFSVLLIAIVIMLIVISSSSIIGSKAIETAKFENFKSELNRVSDNVNEYYIRTGNLPLTGSEKTVNGVDGKVLDISLIQDTSIEKGSGKNGDDDLYVISESDQKIYYVKGVKYRGKVYYTN